MKVKNTKKLLLISTLASCILFSVNVMAAAKGPGGPGVCAPSITKKLPMQTPHGIKTKTYVFKLAQVNYIKGQGIKCLYASKAQSDAIPGYPGNFKNGVCIPKGPAGRNCSFGPKDQRNLMRK